jgi:hypothetical protein
MPDANWSPTDALTSSSTETFLLMCPSAKSGDIDQPTVSHIP